MLNREALEEMLKLNYSDIISGTTNRIRQYNIKCLTKLIIEDIKKNNLVYGEKERRIEVYTTSKNEHIYIQYPGLYSKPNKNGEVKVPFDFRPVAVFENNGKSKDMDFEDIWRILQKFIKGHKNLMGIINTLLFKMGRMLDYQLVEDQMYESEIIIANDEVYPSDTMTISLYKLVFPNEEMLESLNFLAENIDAGDGETMSLEAFLYYLELLLQIEDCKYNRDKIEDCVGRIPSSDSLIIISSYSNKQIDLANMLMRFVRYRGIARCDVSEYSIATNGIVSITNVKNHIEDVCELHNIEYKRSRKFKISETLTIPIRLKIESKHILILNDHISNEAEKGLQEIGWTAYDLNDYLGEEKQKKLDDLIINTIDK